MRIVLDTNVLVSALGWDGNERAVLLDAFSEGIDMLISDSIIVEFIEVTSRDKFADIPLDKIAHFLEILMETAEIVDTKTKVTKVKDDEADNRILECAVDGRADYVVTGDRHLLDLKKFKNINILSAGEYLKILRE
jgi:putative PIN family toxin of toxin-antitoxin system